MLECDRVVFRLGCRRGRGGGIVDDDDDCMNGVKCS